MFNGRRLNSWKEVAAYLRRDVRTVQRWEFEGLPVYRGSLYGSDGPGGRMVCGEHTDCRRLVYRYGDSNPGPVAENHVS
jgi:hypothetical protein